MYFETEEDCKTLTDEQIANLTMSECHEIERILGYRDPFMDKIYDRMRRLKAYESMNYNVGDLTVSKLRKFLDGLDDNDIINIYDTYMETSHTPNEVYVSVDKDLKGRKHLFIQIDTD